MTNAAIIGLTASNDGTAPSITYKVCFDNQSWVDNYQYCNGQFDLTDCTTYLQFQNSDGEMVDIINFYIEEASDIQDQTPDLEITI